MAPKLTDQLFRRIKACRCSCVLAFQWIEEGGDPWPWTRTRLEGNHSQIAGLVDMLRMRSCDIQRQTLENSEQSTEEP